MPAVRFAFNFVGLDADSIDRTFISGLLKHPNTELAA
jgi:hypothetical protein